MNPRVFVAFVRCLTLVSLPALAADAVKDYPVRLVRMVNPFPPGGSSDP